LVLIADLALLGTFNRIVKLKRFRIKVFFRTKSSRDRASRILIETAPLKGNGQPNLRVLT
jgi:hypothetical protein